MSDVNILLQQAAINLQHGMLSEAASICSRILQYDRQHADANHLSGLIALKRGDLETAIQLIQYAIKANPDNSEYYLHLGLAQYQSGSPEDSCISWEQATLLNPETIDGYINLGAAYIELERIDDALTATDKALRIDPASAEAHINRGNALARLGRTNEAANEFQNAIKFRPNIPEAHNALGNALRELGKFRESLIPYEYALKLNPGYAQAWCNYGLALWDLGNKERAYKVFKTALGLNPELDVAKYLTATFDSSDIPPRPPANYVTQLFDRYAETFDKELVENLHYRTPDHLYEAVCSELGDTIKMLNILDLGCGTGLCGKLFSRISDHMVGVDLSQGMLDMAERRGVYTRLMRADINHVLSQSDYKYDLILSADVFVYIGDLEEVFKLATSNLVTNGLFAFSIEFNESCDDYNLRDSGRYAHSQEYIHRLAKRYGLTVCSAKMVILRYQSNLPVHGCVFILTFK